MRLYTINNMYLSSIQNGIQAAHVVHELFNKYDLSKMDGIDHKSMLQREKLVDWSENHKTMIVLNGGMTEQMEPMLPIIEASGLPWASFYEPGIGNALTCIGIVVPERLYGADLEQEYRYDWYSKMFGAKTDRKLTVEEFAFITKLKSMSLAK